MLPTRGIGIGAYGYAPSAGLGLRPDTGHAGRGAKRPPIFEVLEQAERRRLDALDMQDLTDVLTILAGADLWPR